MLWLPSLPSTASLALTAGSLPVPALLAAPEPRLLEGAPLAAPPPGSDPAAAPSQGGTTASQDPLVLQILFYTMGVLSLPPFARLLEVRGRASFRLTAPKEERGGEGAKKV